jgi:hypothetical protein
MTRLEVITPSYAPDLELLEDLNRSVLRRCPDDVVHQVVVPARDATLFARLADPRTRIRPLPELLPGSMVQLPRANVWLNVRRPWPPVRGWITQQVVKLAAAAESAADVVLLADSDIVLLRPVTAASFLSGDDVVLYRNDEGVHSGMPRHLRWHAVARVLLGLPPAEPGPLPDYIATPCAWDPAIVRSLLVHVERVAGRPWQTAVGAQVHLSEMILYGVYVDEVLGRRSGTAVTSDMRCVTHWPEEPLDGAGVQRLFDSVRPQDLGVMISAKSGTGLANRHSAISAWERAHP